MSFEGKLAEVHAKYSTRDASEYIKAIVDEINKHYDIKLNNKGIKLKIIKKVGK